MSLTPEQIARSVLKSRRGRGQIFKLRHAIWEWLQSTPWFERRYPEQSDQVNLVDDVEKTIRSVWAANAAKTRQENAVAKEKALARIIEEARQGKFDF